MWLYSGPWLVFAEWTESRQEVRRDVDSAELTHRAWQVVGLLGDHRRVPHRARCHAAQALRAGKGRGGAALLLSVRYGELDVDPDAFPLFADPTRSVERLTNAGVSLGWSLNRALKLVLDYQNTSFEGGARRPATARPSRPC